MSDLQRSFVKSKLSKLPPVPAFAEADEDGLDEQAPPPSSAAIPRLAKRKQQMDDFSPRTAEGYFEQALEVDVPLDTGSASFRVYYTSPPPKPAAQQTRFKPPQGGPASVQNLALDVSSPALPTLKPGVGLPADDADDDDEATPLAQGAPRNPGTLFVFHHGAGFSALSYALTAAEITKLSGGEVGVLAYDCRGHGRTRLHNVKMDPLDMSIDVLAADLLALLSAMFPRTEEMPSLVLVGHSMGGSVVVSAAHALSAKGFNRISGVAVLDVVEGTAMDALSVMRSVVLGHPSGFASVEDAIRWHVDSKTIANPESARISVPPLIEPNPTFTAPARHPAATDDEPQEVLDDASEPAERDTQQHAYRWRADLLATEPFWPSWFRGLSSRFLSVKTARLLLLAGTDRLDRELMIGQMQGKYQLEVIADVGHSLHEDAPDRTARILIDFWRRNERIHLPLKNIKKVGEP
ncbi:related to Protein phosphatase methylesterase 1 [Sporisorium reilianum SRZ2]|uniref:Protein phosphatase methylesterase 1 n=1 Tax=Sporisorium reilianum (strain SRZ2) TaxID=999809 RepID=E6ZLT6_SPORE|nr:related to Protein phosphatase methylesterase 1 [Sporisorium reilianum SRZ2]